MIWNWSTIPLVLSILLSTPAVGELRISHVRADAESFDPRAGESISVKFHLSDPAHVELRIYDVRDLLIRTVESDRLLQKGDHQLDWNGMDQSGSIVPGEGYYYSIYGKTEDAQEVDWDPKGYGEGKELLVEDISWNPEAGEVTFRIDRPGRIALRVGLPNNGPLLKTLLDWAPRPRGVGSISWDGWDHSKTLNVGTHPNLVFQAWGSTLAKNVVFVRPFSDRVQWIEQISWPRVSRVDAGEQKSTERIFAFRSIPADERRDVDLLLSISDKTASSEDGIPIISGPTSFHVDVNEIDRERILSQRFEIGFFVDGIPVYENEVAYLPLTWIWNPKQEEVGHHYVTANLWGYSGSLGSNTVKVEVRASQESEK